MSWQDNVRTVIPYTPGEQPQSGGVIKINTNENPYAPAPGVEELAKKLDVDQLKLYPDPDCKILIDALAEYHGLHSNQVFVGVGSDDVLAMSFLTFFNGTKPVLFPDITYSFYDVWTKLFRIPYECQQLDENFQIVKKDYLRENGGIVIANPNAPTSLVMPLEEIEEIVAANSESVVIIDEAYIDFGGETAQPLIEHYNNLLVVRTYSKSRSMAGLRIGYAMGQPELIQAMNNVKASYNSYTMNLPSLLLGVESLKDEAYFRERIEQVIRTREWTKEQLMEMGFDVLESGTNFLFASPKSMSAAEVFEKLKARNIFVRYFSKPRICDYLRISIGTEEQMVKVVEELHKILNR